MQDDIVLEVDFIENNGAPPIVSIYYLFNPVTKLVFYVGATNEPRNRMRQHMDGRYSKNIKKLIEIGASPEMYIIEECGYADAPNLESYWIWQMRSWGFVLENKGYKSGYSKKTASIHYMDKRLMNKTKGLFKRYSLDLRLSYDSHKRKIIITGKASPVALNTVREHIAYQVEFLRGYEARIGTLTQFPIFK